MQAAAVRAKEAVGRVAVQLWVLQCPPHKLTRVDSQAVRFHEKRRTKSRLFVAGLGFKRSLTQLQGNNLQSDVALPQ